ncbi:MAG: TonB-dependent receptor [Saprospiraceae bacterium]|nr:TonB-dependent receptor [Saprospiraceae bacterium]MCF8249924.1 TonB-dependent receptor [Saprospiraceae bacterium]MCF8279337.1 TonB-dependent receptor [Bacteroidales bacterium]MCF8310028.1 TonB-dependent receptor [Saprospiraceae bacterium]MCF8438928.1 TonB-dependent receptor [Saprospiraceae bacterium]
MKKILLAAFTLALFVSSSALAQKGGGLRGNVLDKNTGEPIMFGTVLLQGTSIGTNTDVDGFFSIGNVPVGSYTMVVSSIGFDSAAVKVTIKEGGISSHQVTLSESSIQLGAVEISSRREQARSDVSISKVTVTANQIKALPGTGGQADIAQYLPVLPGIISTGDQGGQIYIRGGSPIQNRILLDGMTIFNPFHSIGFYSVFETEIIKTVDVLTAGFNAEYGGRVSAVIDLKTREGNRKRISGLVSANPFQAKAVLEGPIKKFEEGGGSSSFIFTAKHSYINETSPLLYSYAVDTTFYPSAGEGLSENDRKRLPFSFTDFYGKISFMAANGSKLNLFGFNFNDDVNYIGVAKLGWQNVGGGTSFTLIPPNSNLIIGGTVAYSDYNIELQEAGEQPRSSGISNYNVKLDFTYFGLHNEIKYGFEIIGLDTRFKFRNFVGNTINQNNNTSELGAFVKYKAKYGDFIFEPSLRLQVYASQSKTLLEPRLGMKYNVTDHFRLKAAGGFYSQNLISSVNELDVVNLFVGFLTAPEEQVFKSNTTELAPHRLQKAVHAVFGTEIDLAKKVELNVEPYYKGFTQLIQINRNKLTPTDPNFVTEKGKAYGIDLTLRYETKKVYLWGTYSLAYVDRDDGEQIYPTIFDRRHNVNLLGTYKFGKTNDWEAALRWNMGSGFPFTLTQGFYENTNFDDGLNTSPLTNNGDLGVVLDTKRNGGRLPFYHRMDGSLKRTFKFGKYTSLEVVASASNMYNRENIFYFDRIRAKRINQLPIMPSLGITFNF